MKYLQTDNIPESFSTKLGKIAKKILRYEAQLILQKYKPKIIAVTGGVGKTLTKEAVYAVISRKFPVRKSEKSFTAQLGVPLAIIGCPYGTNSVIDWARNILFGVRIIFFKTHYPDWLLLEIDNDKSGDLATVFSLIHPDMIVVTAIGDVPPHIENFASIHNYKAEMLEAFAALKKNGVIIYNADDSIVSALVAETNSRNISCGLENAEIMGSEFTIQYGESAKVIGMQFEISHSSQSYNVNIRDSVGVQNENAALLAFSVGIEMQFSPKDIVIFLSRLSALPGRMRLLPGVKDTLIIDDSYNSSPIAMKQAISVLKKIKTIGRKVVVVGDMLELGKYSAEEHKKIAHGLKNIAGYVYTVGFRAKRIADELGQIGFSKKHIESFDTPKHATEGLQNLLKAGDIVFLKGSQAMRMERIVEELMQNPKDKKKLLVRQGEDWKNK